MSQPLSYIENPAFRVDVLSRADIEQIHTATLEIIETVGVKFPLPEALDILAANGAEIDRETCIARIPAAVVEDALKSAPPTYTLAARDPERDLPLDGNHVFLGTDGCGVQVQDAFSGELRTSTKKDVSDCARAADALDEIGFLVGDDLRPGLPAAEPGSARVGSRLERDHQTPAD